MALQQANTDLESVNSVQSGVLIYNFMIAINTFQFQKFGTAMGHPQAMHPSTEQDRSAGSRPEYASRPQSQISIWEEPLDTTELAHNIDLEREEVNRNFFHSNIFCLIFSGQRRKQS